MLPDMLYTSGLDEVKDHRITGNNDIDQIRSAFGQMWPDSAHHLSPMGRSRLSLLACMGIPSTALLSHQGRRLTLWMRMWWLVRATGPIANRGNAQIYSWSSYIWVWLFALHCNHIYYPAPQTGASGRWSALRSDQRQLLIREEAVAPWVSEALGQQQQRSLLDTSPSRPLPVADPYTCVPGDMIFVLGDILGGEMSGPPSRLSPEICFCLKRS